ncbi:hypothetical protein LEP1GSC040_1070 [Leptospira santarosai str. 2000030832]|nr:hypothetical protein LEP1GSC040_1070 [Leptospira santarosai str. 2000030832]
MNLIHTWNFRIVSYRISNQYNHNVCFPKNILFWYILFWNVELLRFVQVPSFKRSEDFL